MSAATNAGVGRKDVLMSPKKLAPKPKQAQGTPGSSVLKAKLPKKPASSALAEDVLFLGAAFSTVATKPTVTDTDDFEALWSLVDEDQQPTCKYNENQVTKSLLLKDEDPFMPHKSPPQQASVNDLWSIQGVSDSAQVTWDPNDPMTHCVNPYVAEGFTAPAFEKSQLRSNSKVPIEDKSVDCEQVVEIKEEEVEVEQQPIADEVGQPVAAAPEFLAEIKSEPEQNIQCPQELQVLKAEFVYIPETTEAMELDIPETGNMEVNIFDVCDDQVSVQGFQALLDSVAEPDPEFMAAAEQQLQAVAAERLQQTAAFDSTINLGEINDMVDPAILPLLAADQQLQLWSSRLLKPSMILPSMRRLPRPSTKPRRCSWR